MARMSQSAETFADQILNFSLPERSARGRAVRLDGVLDDNFVLFVQSRSGFVEDKNLGALQECSSNCQALFLTP